MGAPHTDRVRFCGLHASHPRLSAGRFVFHFRRFLAILALLAIPFDTPATMDEIFSTQPQLLAKRTQCRDTRVCWALPSFCRSHICSPPTAAPSGSRLFFGDWVCNSCLPGS